MFRSARWRSERNRIKVVFRLQFNATQVPQSNSEKLTISLVPGDVGKPTARLENAVLHQGCCRWESSVFETVKFVQDAKSGKVNQRIYHLIVSTTSTGSAMAGSIGEALIDFADYADAMKTSYISLPLRNSNSNSNAMLHVSIQRQQVNSDPQREADESGLKSHLSAGDAYGSHNSSSQEEEPFSKTAQRRASVGSVSTISSSDSISELNTHGDVENHHKFCKGNPSILLSSSTSMSEEPHVSESEWSGSSDHGISTDDSTNSSNDTIPRNISRNSSDAEIEKLKADLIALTRQADLSELELQSLRKQTVKESKRSQDLLREVTSLKQERDSLKAECEKFKASEKQKEEVKSRNKAPYNGRDPWIHLEETRQELDYEKDLNSNLRLQLQKTQESNNELILAVQDLEEMIGQRNNEAASEKESMRKVCRSDDDDDDDDDEDQKALEELVKGHIETKETHELEKKITDLYNEIEIYKRDKDELEIQLEQLALDYEILKQENHDISYKLEQSQLQEQLKIQYECSSSLVNVNELEDHIESLEAKLGKQSEQFSESLKRIKELETRIEGLEEEMENRAQIFEEDLESVTRGKIEQEKRAIEAEEALRRTRWKNASIAERLQEEFKRLSGQMTSTFEANEKMAMRAMAEANEMRMQKRRIEEMQKNANIELQMTRDEYETKLDELSRTVNLKTVEIDRLLEDLDNHKRREQDVTRDLDGLRKDKNALALQLAQAESLRVELESARKSLEEAEASERRHIVERNELINTIALMNKESEVMTEEINELKRIKIEKEASITRLQEEVESLRARCDDLKASLSENDTENEKEKKQLREDVKKKEEAVANLEKKLRDSRAVISNITRSGLRSNKSGSVAQASKEVSTMKERIKLLEGQIKMKENALEASSNMFIEKERDLKKRIEELETKLEQVNQNSEALNQRDDLGDEVAELERIREQNIEMESELKEMQERYSELSLKFAEVEGERQQLVMTVRNLRNSKKK